jgi:hypothetical protein
MAISRTLFYGSPNAHNDRRIPRRERGPGFDSRRAHQLNQGLVDKLATCSWLMRQFVATLSPLRASRVYKSLQRAMARIQPSGRYRRYARSASAQSTRGAASRLRVAEVAQRACASILRRFCKAAASAFVVSVSAGLLPSVPPKVLEFGRRELGISYSLAYALMA